MSKQKSVLRPNAWEGKLIKKGKRATTKKNHLLDGRCVTDIS